MGTGFQKFKARLMRSAIIKSLLYGASLGLCTVGGLVLATRLSLFRLDILFCALIGAGVLLVFGGALFLILRPSDEKIALRVDRALCMNEKVRTMVAFRGGEGDMLEIQRTDTDSRLASTPAKALKLRDAWVSPVSFLLSLALCVCAFLIPVVAAEPEEPVVDEYEQNWRIVRLQGLIDQVQKSLMQEPVKASTVSQLEELLEVVRSTDLENTMKEAAVKTVVGVDSTVENANSAPEIAAAMADTDTTEMKALATAIEALGGTALKREMRTIRSNLQNGDLGEAILDLNALLDASLRLSGVSAEDSLYTIFKNLSYSLADISGKLTSTSSSQIQKDLDSAFDTAMNAAADELANQRDNRSMGDTVIKELIDIFAITDDDLKGENDEPIITPPSDNPGTNLPDFSQDDDPSLNEGGLGSGQILYGSDDTIYDPELDKFVTYGEVIDRYFSQILALKQDGKLSEEMSAAFDAYFASLYNGSKTGD